MKLEALRRFVNEKNIDFKENESLYSWTTFHCSSSAIMIIEPSSLSELSDLVIFFNKNQFIWKKDWDLLGNGSNVLFVDKGYKGVLVHLGHKAFSELSVQKETNGTCLVKIGAGLLNGKLFQWAREKSLSGFEFAFGIPGSIGGGVRMNAGTPSGAFGNILRNAECMNLEGGVEHIEVSRTDFLYRDFPKVHRKIVLSCTIELRKSNSKTINEHIESAKEKRRSQPLDLPNFGSVFKNPEGDYAGRMIEDCGLKGYRIGDAEISNRHANFIVNHGHALTADVQSLINHAQHSVMQKFGVALEPEVIVLGEHDAD
ncbi:MAG: UDP-N-acetylmuramate dehydrogenase [Bdellovibrionales bacterium]|nr:UDP-N-acetylmuramate dehydrogenase [Bdellovibrionales bacterium]